MTATASSAGSRQRRFQIAFLVLMLIPMLPEIVIWATAAMAALKGCHPNQKELCLLGSLPVSDIIAYALQAGAGLIVAGIRASQIWLIAFYAGITGWLVACYVVLTRGWSNTLTRLVMGFTVALVFAFMPYFGSMLAIANLVNENCRPNDGGVGPCQMFGGYVGSPDRSPAHDAVTLGWLAPYGALMTLATFVLYALVVVIIAVIAQRRHAGPEQRITAGEPD